MAKIIVIDENYATPNLLVKYLQTVGAGFEVVDLGNYSVEAVYKNLLDNIGNINNSGAITKSIFPAIPKLEKVFKYIELNYQEPISLKEVAQFVGYSDAYLTDLVGKLSGKTVNEWIAERRLAEARNLLLKTNRSVHDIALAVGYQTPNYFFKQFRNYHNASPKAWKQTHSNHSSC